MSQCIHLACKEEAWTDPQDPTRRSYFCLIHADRASRGHLVFTPPQWEVFNKEGFEDALVTEDCGFGKVRMDPYERIARFPEDFLLAQESRTTPALREKNFNDCFRCGKRIVSGYRWCGKCRTELDVEEDRDNEQMVTCEHYRAEQEPGHVFTRNCKRIVPISQSVLFHGARWCADCRAYVLGINKEARLKNGYAF